MYMRRDLEKTEEKALLHELAMHAGYHLHWALPSHWTSRVEAIAVASTTGHACSTYTELALEPSLELFTACMSLYAVWISWCIKQGYS